MKRILFGSFALATSIWAAPAMAAELPVKAPPRPPAAYDWSGVYFGLNAGWVRQSETWTYTNPAPATPPTSSAHHIDRDDGILGIHVGLQRQFNHVVIGAEGAIAWPTSRKFGTSGLQCVDTVGSLCQARAGTLLTAGGRLGWAWNRWLVFGTGGWAQLAIDSQELTAPPTVFDYSEIHRQNGFYAGGGVEYAVVDHVIVGVEYQHIDVGSAFHASSADLFAPSPPRVNGRNISGREDIVRGRLSVKFFVPRFLGTSP